MVTRLRSYALEVTWLLVLTMMLGAGAAPAASDHNWNDAGNDCPPDSMQCEGV